MTANTKVKRVEFLEKITHYIAALVIVLKGMDKLETPGKVWYGVVLIAIGVLIVAGSVFHHKAEKLLKHFKAYVFGLEAVVMSIIGYLYVSEGKQFIQYVCFAAAVGFAIALVVYISKGRRSMAETHLN